MCKFTQELLIRYTSQKNEGSDQIVSTISAQITYNVVENDGKITNLQ